MIIYFLVSLTITYIIFMGVDVEFFFDFLNLKKWTIGHVLCVFIAPGIISFLLLGFIIIGLGEFFINIKPIVNRRLFKNEKNN